MTQEEETELRAELARLRQEHRDLDAAIEALQGSLASDILQVQRLKKRKLFLRDRITHIEDQLTPDIIARGGEGRVANGEWEFSPSLGLSRRYSPFATRHSRPSFFACAHT